MPYAEKICGIYQISTPNGNLYIGSSTHIKLRWAEHRSVLRRGNHHSVRLQAAFKKHGDALAFSILEECAIEVLNEREQHHIDTLGAKLNTGTFVNNVWANPATAEKLRKIFSSEDFRSQRRLISARLKKSSRRVHCSDGRVFDSIVLAARAFGIRGSGIMHLAKSHHLGRLGVRFRFDGDEWLALETSGEKNWKSRRLNGNGNHSADTRRNMSIAAKRRGVSALMLANAREASICPVVGSSIYDGAERSFPSIMAAALAVRPEKAKSAATLICQNCSGIKKTAYGFVWRRATKSRPRDDGEGMAHAAE